MVTLDMRGHEDRQMSLLADSDNREILTALAGSGRPLHVYDIAVRLVEGSGEGGDTTDEHRRIEEACLSLHHNVLPRLDEAGLLEYDPDGKTATLGQTPLEEVDRVVSDWVRDVSTNIQEAGAGIDVIEGRQSIIEHGQTLADEAKREMIYFAVSTDQFEAACINRAKAAIDRGVHVAIGSPNPDVRKRARQLLPGATVWTPQRNLLNAPTRYPRVGRLVLVDDHSVMLGVLERGLSNDGYPDETAMLGEGEHDPLVVLVRDVLGPGLDLRRSDGREFGNELHS